MSRSYPQRTAIRAERSRSTAPRDKDARSSEAAALDPLDARGQRVSKSQPVTMMANLEEMSRVLYSHDWARVQDWVTALDQLATLTDDEIAALVHQARPTRTRPSSVKRWNRSP